MTLPFFEDIWFVLEIPVEKNGGAVCFWKVLELSRTLHEGTSIFFSDPLRRSEVAAWCTAHHNSSLHLLLGTTFVLPRTSITATAAFRILGCRTKTKQVPVWWVWSHRESQMCCKLKLWDLYVVIHGCCFFFPWFKDSQIWQVIVLDCWSFFGDMFMVATVVDLR